MRRLLPGLFLLMVALVAWVATPVSCHHERIRMAAEKIEGAVDLWIRDPSSEPKRKALHELASADSEWVRVQLYAQLMAFGNRRSLESDDVARGIVDVFRRGLADPASIVRTEACKGIASSKLVASLMVDDLIQVIKSNKDSPISWCAAEAIGMSGTNRADAVELLTWGLQFPTSRPLLDGRFNQNQGLRDDCVNALSQLGTSADAAHGELAKYLNDLDQLFRVKVAFAMISIRADSPQAMDAISGIWADRNAEIAARNHVIAHYLEISHLPGAPKIADDEINPSRCD